MICLLNIGISYCELLLCVAVFQKKTPQRDADLYSVTTKQSECWVKREGAGE